MDKALNLRHPPSPPLISFSLSCPFPCPVFRFRRLVVRGAGPGSDPASILQRTAFCLGGGASESLQSWVPGLLLVRKFVNEDARSVVGIEVFADFVAVGVEVAAVEPFDVVLLREFDFNLFVLQLFELVAVAEELLQCDARRQIDPSQGVLGEIHVPALR